MPLAYFVDEIQSPFVINDIKRLASKVDVIYLFSVDVLESKETLPKNVIVFNYNKQVFDALDRYGITPHIVPFRHRYFWDGGIHCVTSDLHREGTMQDYFPERG
jgi:hypothetical protein